ncbi:hypothetical protein POM88_044736 [Heracleum sosnowskyi]|uniref:Uncharacterized protein n=1 Tax=Heracleum sosnowskyi TaxID=360622 RepID=A0AAD8H3B8_9APIA|nr:hypothetical protein POM88_044736 [Heracleum sosnowskyi]
MHDDEDAKRTIMITKIYSGSSTCYILESEIASSGQEFRTNNKTSIYVATNPRGAEGLPPDIVEPYSDLYFNELLTSSRKESVVKPKYLLALTVGYNQKEIVDKMVSKFSENFSIVLFHYDGRASAWEHFEWPRRAIHISSEKQTKWWYAKRFLHPHIVAGYEYMFIWDEDIGVENFNADEEAKGQECPYPHSPPCAGFVEIMVPVFSIKSWSCVWRMLQNDLVHGWGLDLNLWRCVERPQEDIGVIDAQWVEHMEPLLMEVHHGKEFEQDVSLNGENLKEDYVNKTTFIQDHSESLRKQLYTNYFIQRRDVRVVFRSLFEV